MNVSERPESDDDVRRERLWPLAAPTEVGAERPDEQRLAPPDRATQRLTVVVPRALAATDAPQRTADQAWQPDAHRQVQPDDDVGRAKHEVAELVLVTAVDHPAVG